jgi:predicted transcriptional regulator
MKYHPSHDEFTQREREEKRAQFRQDALAAWAAWADYQATGLHVTAGEADAWLAKLVTGELAAIPECHD